jgi:hypothetical protein
MEDINAFLSLRGVSQTPWQSYDFMAIGLDAVDKYLWPIKYFATQHPTEIEKSIGRRVLSCGNIDFKIIAHKKQKVKSSGRELVDIVIPMEDGVRGSSSLMGVQAGIQLNYKKIILCGCPLTGKNSNNYEYANYQAGWLAKYEQIKNVARSMSGWTKELLGAPDESWLLEAYCSESLERTIPGA